ncbi:hypothetical protein [Cyclobacterium marinum]|uniref:Uncharacterized protein n=1 Tax=Cyclobacterium marinum (strain ATCC 25205 / DSM 745 / LMG 13164 / NCIMB 1802) TaxID=880070 RepID=G0J0F7_CYCMS|nr:hypothetical protein [Cyclobacterium marinum]AEL23873.1 hypothetical protein Cycma_0088 [Cyclobacterium marinum DSM 745]
MPNLQQQKQETEAWLRDHPQAEWQTRYDMIKRLAEIDSKLKNNNKNATNQQTKVLG